MEPVQYILGLFSNRHCGMHDFVTAKCSECLAWDRLAREVRGYCDDIRNAALEEAAKVAETYRHQCTDVMLDRCRDIAKEIRALSEGKE